MRDKTVTALFAINEAFSVTTSQSCRLRNIFPDCENFIIIIMSIGMLLLLEETTLKFQQNETNVSRKKPEL